MYTVNYIKLLFCCKIMIMIMVSSLINNFEEYLPSFVSATFRYGKFASVGKFSLTVSKSWFKHFYIYSSTISTFTLIYTIKIYVFNGDVANSIVDNLDLVGGYFREPTVTPIHTIIALFLFTLQSLRRFYDTQYVSVFSETAKMDLSHYLIGFSHYTGALLAILIEAPYFARTDFDIGLRFGDLKLSDFLAILLFLYAWRHQYNVTVILGNLRKNSKGEVICQEYKLPSGDWFEYLSAPHLIAEILMYFSLTVILWGNLTWLFVFGWVLSNQVETALLTHWWYQDKFTNYPNKRKVLIPFLY